MLTARLEIEFIDAPVLKIVTERKHAHFVDQMELPGAVEIEYRAERLRVTVEEVLVVDERIVVAELAKRLVGVAVAEAAETRVRKAVEGAPEDLVLDATDVYADTSVERLGAHYHEGLRGQRGHGARVGPLKLERQRRRRLRR